MWGVSDSGPCFRVDIGVVTYEAMTPQCGNVSDSGPGCQSGSRSCDQ